MSHGSSNSRGVAIFIKKGVDYTPHSKIIAPLGRYIILKAEIKDKIYVLINIYAPNKDKDSFKFFAELLAKLKNETLDEEENIIVGGDSNCPLNAILDKKGGILTPRKSVVSIINSMQGDLDIRWLTTVFPRLSSARYDSLPHVSIRRACKHDASNLKDYQNLLQHLKGVKSLWYTYR